ncbi:TdeIII family type II restriction endonuclease [Paenibacillus sp. TAB 01]|uniref:TdeIII family type II restriction endonuclease n=1 Tax=Paenibacillus sp. TAB 01 TaxID=3368988 RepID=UPI0037535F80
MDKETRKKVKKHIMDAMDKKIEDMTINNPYDEEGIIEVNPFGARIVPSEVWRGSKFERSFVTSLGQGILEQVAKIIAEGTGASAKNQYKKTIKLNTHQRDTIDKIVNRQKKEKGKKVVTPDIKDELKKLRNTDHDATVEIEIISDLYVKRTDGTKEFYSFKTVKPNKDQTAAAKMNLLFLRTANKDYKAYLALPYNPAKEGNSYMAQSHKIPANFFDMDDKNYVLIGSALWNKIGNDKNTYNELLKIFDEVGEITRDRIRREYFELE